MNTNKTMTPADARAAALREKLSAGGYRITPQRLCIVEALIESQHPSAEDIYARVRRVSPTTSLATVYKTLETLRDMGEVLEMEVGDGRRHFDGVRPEFHPHVVCTRCGTIADVEIGDLGGLQARAAQASGYDLRAQRVDFYGLCASCRERKDERE